MKPRSEEERGPHPVWLKRPGTIAVHGEPAASACSAIDPLLDWATDSLMHQLTLGLNTIVTRADADYNCVHRAPRRHRSQAASAIGNIIAASNPYTSKSVVH